jgi:hemerythrin-like domain-containing protein
MFENLENAIEKLQSGHSVDERTFNEAFDFIEHLVYGRHIPKELHVFKIMTARDVSQTDDLLPQTHREHEEIRSFVEASRRAYPDAAKGIPAAIRMLVENMLAFIGMMEVHIHRENVTFEMVEEVLSEADDRAVIAVFEKINSDADCTME